MSGSRFSITDYETKNTLVLIDNPMLGKEYQLKKESSFKEVLKDAEVEEGDKAIFFLGYTCKQYLIKKEGVLYWRYT